MSNTILELPEGITTTLGNYSPNLDVAIANANDFIEEVKALDWSKGDRMLADGVAEVVIYGTTNILDTLLAQSYASQSAGVSFAAYSKGTQKVCGFLQVCKTDNRIAKNSVTVSGRKNLLRLCTVNGEKVPVYDREVNAVLLELRNGRKKTIGRGGKKAAYDLEKATASYLTKALKNATEAQVRAAIDKLLPEVLDNNVSQS